MNCSSLFAILAVIFGSTISYQLNSVKANFYDDRIIGGETARLGQFPYQASLRSVDIVNNSIEYRYRCGGCIISNRWILSGAACTEKPYSNPSRIVIVVGGHHIKNDGKMHHLNRIVNHPKFNRKNRRNDICLLQTNKTIHFTAVVQPIPLSKRFVKKGVAATVTGWGRYQLAGMDYTPEYLQFLQVITLTNKECLARYMEIFPSYIYDGTLCTFVRQGHGVCHGDFGGPLVSNGHLIGVSSWAYPCAHIRPDGFTRISKFTKWIRKVSGVVAV